MPPQLQPHRHRTEPAPICPKCGHLMAAATREARTGPRDFHARVGAPTPPRPNVDVWRCDTCGIDRPRFS